jgi:hypothetical protein
MKSFYGGPDKNQGQNQRNFFSAILKTSKKSVYSEVNSDKSKNYKGGDDPVNGPNWDRVSRNDDGCTSGNAGFYK